MFERLHFRKKSKAVNQYNLIPTGIQFLIVDDPMGMRHNKDEFSNWSLVRRSTVMDRSM